MKQMPDFSGGPALSEALERQEKKARAHASYVAASAALAAEQALANKKAGNTAAVPKRRHRTIGKGTAAVLGQPLARLRLRVLEAVRPHEFASRTAGGTGAGLTLYVMFEVEGERGRCQTRYNPPGSALVWLDPVIPAVFSIWGWHLTFQ